MRGGPLKRLDTKVDLPRVQRGSGGVDPYRARGMARDMGHPIGVPIPARTTCGSKVHLYKDPGPWTLRTRLDAPAPHRRPVPTNDRPACLSDKQKGAE